MHVGSRPSNEGTATGPWYGVVHRTCSDPAGSKENIGWKKKTNGEQGHDLPIQARTSMEEKPELPSYEPDHPIPSSRVPSAQGSSAVVNSNDPWKGARVTVLSTGPNDGSFAPRMHSALHVHPHFEASRSIGPWEGPVRVCDWR